MTLQEWLLCSVLLVAIVQLGLIALVLRSARKMPDVQPPRHAEPQVQPSRGILPMSTIHKHGGHIPDVFVFDEEEGTFRRVGLVNADGKSDGKDAYGDGIRLVKGKLYRIVARPQRVAFRPERIIIGKGSTPGGAADWNVHDFQIGNRSQFSQSGALPGDMFDSEAIDSFVAFETAQTAMDVSMDVAYVGPNPSEPFTCSIIGTEARYAN